MWRMMMRYTIGRTRVAGAPRLLLSLVVCLGLCMGLTGCADLWMAAYRAKGGYYESSRVNGQEVKEVTRAR